MAESGDQLTIDLVSEAIRRGEAAGFWRLVERGVNALYFEVCAFDGEIYLLELTCDHYGVQPMRGKFVDTETHKCIATAWPLGNETFAGWFKWKPNDLFICWPGDRGGCEHHTDWQGQKYWKRTSNQLHQYLEFIRQCLNLRGHGYQGRNRC